MTREKRTRPSPRRSKDPTERAGLPAPLPPTPEVHVIPERISKHRQRERGKEGAGSHGR